MIKLILFVLKVFLGPLPSNFLRLESHSPQQQQEAADQQAAIALHQLQMQVMPPVIDPRMGRLSVTIVQVLNNFINFYFYKIKQLVSNWSIFSGKVGQKLWHDEDGSLCQNESGSCSL